MPNVRTKIKSLYASLSPAQKQLADYILLQNGDEVPFLRSASWPKRWG